MSEYDHKQVENKWKDLWYKANLYKAEDFSKKPKKYILVEFPYPSGKALHAGHMMRFTVPDIYARYMRMKGYNVLFPFGYDAFGLPAETYAIKTGNHPSKIIAETVDHYKESVKRMGYGIDWEREICTTDPKYYKWTQWIFLKLFKAGLAEYREMPIWWCEQLKTVLSEEEVLTDKSGNKISERGEFPVSKKMLKQWVLKITNYADKLLQGLNEVDYPEAIKSAQTNWIGKSTGAYVDFKVGNEVVSVFTTRPDTLFGVTFLAIAAEHEFLSKHKSQITNWVEVEEFILKVKKQSDLERQTDKKKVGVKLEGVYATHPLNEVTTQIPIFVTNYVLTDYGTGAVMGVPAHDERDYEFAKQYNVQIIPVIKPKAEVAKNILDAPYYTGDGTIINSGRYNELSNLEFFDEVITRLQSEGTGKPGVTYKLRDWIFSRQRYWGEPIPLIHTDTGKIEPICDPDSPADVASNLPLTLPELPDYNPTGDGNSPLERNLEWVETKDKLGKPAKRETNTMPNWAGSCWYFIRYTDPNNDDSFANSEKLKYWLPVDRYFGGAEHTTMHLLYSRFWYQFLHDLNLVPTKEPYAWRMNGGTLLGPDGKRMSKSRGNVIEPIDLVEKYGADALRLSISFLGPYQDTYPWNDNSMKATYRLITTIYDLAQKVSDTPADSKLLTAYNTLVKNVTSMLEDLKMNTAVSELMIFTNKVKELETINLDIWKGFLRVLAPFAPYIAEELWYVANGHGDWQKQLSVHLQGWPTYEEKYLHNEITEIPVQVNGKLRGVISVNGNETEKSALEKAQQSQKINSFLAGKTIVKTIYVPGKILNIAIN